MRALSTWNASSIRHRLSAVFIVVVAVLFSVLALHQTIAVAAATLYDFQGVSPENAFNPAPGGDTYTINNTGGISSLAGLDTTEDTNIWTAKANTTAVNGELYTIGGYFYQGSNNGFGGIGFSSTDQNVLTMDQAPTTLSGLGMLFHGGG